MFEAQPCRAGSAPRAVVADISPKALDVHGPVLLVNREELEQISEHVVVRELLARGSADFSLESWVCPVGAELAEVLDDVWLEGRQTIICRLTECLAEQQTLRDEDRDDITDVSLLIGNNLSPY
jgi:hypothetical protein